MLDVRKFFLLFLSALAVHGVFAQAPQQMGPVSTPQINSTYYVGTSTGFYPTIQSAVTAACAVGNVRVSIPAGATPADTPTAVTGGCSTVSIEDQHTNPSGCYALVGSYYAACPNQLLPGVTSDGANGIQVTGKVSTPTVNSQQVNGTDYPGVNGGSYGTIQSAVTAAQENSGSVQVPAAVGPGEMQYPAAELTQSGVATSQYSNYLATKVRDQRALNGDVSLAQLINLPSLTSGSEGGDTTRASRCVEAGACTVVVIGNSIHENDNGIYPGDGYVAQLFQDLQNKFPKVTFTFVNLAISGSTVENFIDTTFVCNSAGGHGFFRQAPGGWYRGDINAGPLYSYFIAGPPFYQWSAGCTIGNSWLQSVTAYNPDIVVMGFVENEWGQGTSKFAADMGTAVADIAAATTYANNPPTIILTTDELPNQGGASLYPPDPMQMEGYNEVIRNLAVQDNYLLADADRYHEVFVDGVDTGRRHYNADFFFGQYPTGWQVATGYSGTLPAFSAGTGAPIGTSAASLTFTTGNAAMVTRLRNALDVQITANFGGLADTSVPAIWYRMDAGNGNGYAVQLGRVTTYGTSLYNVYLYSITAGSSTVVSSGQCSFPSANGIALTINVVGAKHDVWCNTVGSNNYTHVISAWDYNKLFSGSVSMGVQSTIGGASPLTLATGNISNEYVYSGNPTEYFTSNASIQTILGTVAPNVYDFYTNPFSYGGDGYHHPSPVGMDTIYLSAFAPVLQRLAQGGMTVNSAHSVSHVGYTGPFGGLQDSLAGQVDFKAGPNGFRIINNAGTAVFATGDDTTTNPMVFTKPITAPLVNPTVSSSNIAICYNGSTGAAVVQCKNVAWSVLLSAGTATVNLTGNAAFTTTNYSCTFTEEAATGVTNVITWQRFSATQFVIRSSNTADASGVDYNCTGY